MAAGGCEGGERDRERERMERQVGGCGEVGGWIRREKEREGKRERASSVYYKGENINSSLRRGP